MLCKFEDAEGMKETVLLALLCIVQYIRVLEARDGVGGTKIKRIAYFPL